MSADNETILTGDVGETVAAGCECPACGESEMDSLIWDADGENVTCQTCGRVYQLGGPTVTD